LASLNHFTVPCSAIDVPFSCFLKCAEKIRCW
jgi:hypothetical protein